MAVGKGSGTTLTHTGMVYKMTNIAWDGHSVAEIGTGDLAAVIRTYEAGNIVDWGTITCDLEWDGAIGLPTLGGAASALVIDVKGVGAGSIFTANAFARELSAVMPNEAAMTGTMVFRLTDGFVET